MSDVPAILILLRLLSVGLATARHSLLPHLLKSKVLARSGLPAVWGIELQLSSLTARKWRIACNCTASASAFVAECRVHHRDGHGQNSSRTKHKSGPRGICQSSPIGPPHLTNPQHGTPGPSCERESDRAQWPTFLPQMQKVHSPEQVDWLPLLALPPAPGRV